MACKIVSILLLLFAGRIYAEPVPIGIAEKAALNWIGEKIHIKTAAHTVLKSHTEFEHEHKAYHVISLSPNGWVIVSADDIAFPIIAYSKEGTYSAGNHSPAFVLWMDTVKKEISAAVTAKLSPQPETTHEWMRLRKDPNDFQKDTHTTFKSITPKSVSPLIKTTWNQNFPYNEQCPYDDTAGENTLTGCVATAMAQIMKYHAWPLSGFGSHDYVHGIYGIISADFGNTVYDWDTMPNSAFSSNVGLSTLLYHCGVSVEMQYGVYASSANMDTDSRTALADYFKYRSSLYAIKKINYSDIDWKDLLKADLDQERPILYAGGNHAFICDGYHVDDFFHFNWGWGGVGDGWFLLDSLTPLGSNFTRFQTAVIQIQPQEEPDLKFPYAEGFENGLPEEWICSGEGFGISESDAYAGNNSLLLSDLMDDERDLVNSAALKVNVPENGVILSFRVKREHDFPTTYNRQTACIKPQFGSEVLLEIFNGDYHDNVWQYFSVDLSPWKNNIVTLYFEQENNNTFPPIKQWMYVDDIKIYRLYDLADAVLALQILTDIMPLVEKPIGSDINKDGKIGVEEVLFILQIVGEIR